METITPFLPTLSSLVVLAVYIYGWGRNVVTKEDLKGIVKQIEELEKKIEEKYVTKEVHELTQKNIGLEMKLLQKK